MNGWAAIFFGTRRRTIGTLKVVLLVVATALGALFAQRTVVGDSALARGEALVKSRKLGLAERVYWEELARGAVTVPLLVAFLDNHHTQEVLTSEGIGVRGDAFIVPDESVDELLARPSLDADVRTMGRFWRGALAKSVLDQVRRDMDALASAEPPHAYANRLLAREAHREGRLAEAVSHYEREGLAFPEHREDLATALQILVYTDDWDAIEKRILDPKFEGHIPSSIRYAYAVRTRNVRLALGSLLESVVGPRPLGPLALAIVSGFMWLLFALRMGRAAERPKFRVPLLVAAFVLGVVSIGPTLALVSVEETLLHFKERGELVSDFIFFTAGVGLREEASKLLLFLPLLPFVRRKGTRLDALAAGAVVGLGFATEENVNYFQQGLATAIARFLTANFLHMALTAILAAAAFDLAREGERGVPRFSRTLFIAIGIHGTYDFFLSNPQIESLSFLAMTIFVVLTRTFMRELRHSSVGAGAPLLPRFVQATAVVTCASFVYASALVGPGAAAFVLIEGLLGLVVIMVMFVQELGRA